MASEAIDKFIAADKTTLSCAIGVGQTSGVSPGGARRLSAEIQQPIHRRYDTRCPRHGRCPDNSSGRRVLHVPGVGFVVINSMATRPLCAHSPTRPHTSNPGRPQSGRGERESGPSGGAPQGRQLPKEVACPLLVLIESGRVLRSLGKWPKFRN